MDPCTFFSMVIPDQRTDPQGFRNYILQRAREEEIQRRIRAQKKGETPPAQEEDPRHWIMTQQRARQQITAPAQPQRDSERVHESNFPRDRRYNRAEQEIPDLPNGHRKQRRHHSQGPYPRGHRGNRAH